MLSYVRAVPTTTNSARRSKSGAPQGGLDHRSNKVSPFRISKSNTKNVRKTGSSIGIAWQSGHVDFKLSSLNKATKHDRLTALLWDPANSLCADGLLCRVVAEPF
jgi:hypothetical protein